MTRPTWNPSDDELDALARTLSAPEPTSSAADHMRAQVLAAAARAPQRSRRASRISLAVAAALPFAAAAAILLWRALPDGPRPKIVSVSTLDPSAKLHTVTPLPDLQMRLEGDGRLHVEVPALDPAERARIVAIDTELETRGAKLVLEAAAGRVASVFVEDGTIVVRHAGDPAVTVVSGDRWAPVRTAQIETTTIEPTPPAPSTAPSPDAPAPPPAPPRRATAKRPTAPVAPPPDASPPIPAPSPPPSAPPSPTSPGELAFRRGWTALKAGDANAASAQLASACTQLRGEALEEDACFWLGVAAKRAGDARAARDALARFVQRFPASARAGEASALLGWLLYERGELDGARRHFERAARDRSPNVRASAEKGILAVDRKQQKGSAR